MLKNNTFAYNVVADNTDLSKFVWLLLRAQSAKFSENLNLYSSSFKLSRTTSPATSLILRLPTTADVFGYLHRRASHIDIHSLWGLSLTGIIWKTI